MNRTVIRTLSVPLNPGKLDKLTRLISAFTQEKSQWVSTLKHNPWQSFATLAKPRELRNATVKAGYTSPLPARLWKIAQEEALATLDRFWQAKFQQVKPRIYKVTSLSEDQRHYCFRILSDYTLLDQLFNQGSPPDPSLKNEAGLPVVLTKQEKITACRILHNKIQDILKHSRLPRIKTNRSVILDQGCYTIYEDAGKQYLAIQSLDKGQRIILPLSGYCGSQRKTSTRKTYKVCDKAGELRYSYRQRHTTGIHFGTLKVVLSEELQAISHIEVHTCQAMTRVTPPTGGEVIGLDRGYNEVLATSTGKLYGTELGDFLNEKADTSTEKGIARNKLRDLANKYELRGSPEALAKARNIQDNNLGKIKFHRNKAREDAHAENIINRSISTLFEEENPAILVGEDLTHAFSCDKVRGASWRHRLSGWVRGVIVKRLAFKTEGKGFSYRSVNAAYSSQLCSCCGWVSQENRNRDNFKCKKCSHADHAGNNAADNLVMRLSDKEITLGMSPAQVKAVLLARYHARPGDLPERKTTPSVNCDLAAVRACDDEKFTVPGKVPDIGACRSQASGTMNGELCPCTA